MTIDLEPSDHDFDAWLRERGKESYEKHHVVDLAGAVGQPHVWESVDNTDYGDDGPDGKVDSLYYIKIQLTREVWAVISRPIEKNFRFAEHMAHKIAERGEINLEHWRLEAYDDFAYSLVW